MFEGYIATEKDFSAIEEGINLAYSKKISFFPRGGLEKADILMFDSKYVYIWSKKRHKLKKLRESVHYLIIYRWKHNKKIQDSHYRRCGGIPEELRKVIFKILEHNKFFFCAPVTCFTKSQKKIRRAGVNPFTTRESYIYTIIHEFGHHYYYLHSNIKANSSKLIRISAKAWNNKKIENFKLPVPMSYISELFAALCDMNISKLLKSKYYQNIKKHYLSEQKDWRKKPDFYLDQIHEYAYALAPAYATQHPKWYEDLL